jgi:endonuclease/exonuclease/phosphatase family metal-dependent hydrolase
MKLSVLQWNIWYAEDIHNVSQLLTELKPDIICLQELPIDHPKQTVANTPAHIAQTLGYHAYHAELPIDGTDGSKITLANGIFSRFPIVDKRFVWINEPKDSGGYDDEYRAYVKVNLDVDGQSLGVATTHMSYTHRFEGTPNKAEETSRLVTELQKQSDRFIFTGDLNAIPGSDTIKAIRAVLQNAGPEDNQKTWTTKPFSYNGFEATTLDWRLDYVFTTPDINVIHSQVISTEFSDHLPILTEIEI